MYLGRYNAKFPLKPPAKARWGDGQAWARFLIAPVLVFIAIVLSLIPHDMQYGPQAALIAEAFTPRLRYSGASLGYQLASIIAGGPAPIIATALMPDYTGKDVSTEYDKVMPGSADIRRRVPT